MAPTLLRRPALLNVRDLPFMADNDLVFVHCFRNPTFSHPFAFIGFLVRLQKLAYVMETASKQLEELCSHSSGQESEKLKEPKLFSPGNITVVSFSFK